MLIRFLATLLTAAALSAPVGLAAAPPPAASKKPALAAGHAAMAPIAQVEGVSEFRLLNGLRVLLIPDASVDTVTVNVIYLVGSRHEGNGETGMAHLLEHLMFRGTKRHPDIKAEFQKRGARYNGTTSFDRTNYYETFPGSQANLDWALDMEADRMINSPVSEKDLAAEMTVVRNEFESGENSAANILRERVTATAYLWHGYGRPIIGARSDIENVPIERLRAFYRSYYQPDNATVIIAGRFNEVLALRSVQRYFGRIAKPSRRLPHTYTVEPNQDGERTVTLRRVGDIQIVSAMYHVPPGAHADYPAIDVLTTVLAHVPTGRLHKSMIQQGKASSVYGNERQQRDAGYVYFGASVRQDMSLENARDALLSTLEGIAAEPITEDELERARTRLLNDIERILADSRSLALTLTETVAMGDWRMLYLHRDRLRELTASDVQRVALSYLKSSNRTLGMFLPTLQPDRAEIPPAPDITAMLRDYRGKDKLAAGESFDPTPANIEARTRRHTLPGGMKVVLLPKKTRGGTVVARLNLHWGDEPSKSGRATACSVTGAMLMRGTRGKTREQIANEFTRLRANGAVGGEGSAIDTVRDNLPAALRLVAELLRQPSFPEPEFDQLRQSSLAGMEAQRSDPGTRASNALRRHLNPYPADHWYYNATPEEQIAKLKELNLEDVRKCHRDFFGASYGELAIIGDFDPEEILELATELFSDWKTPIPYSRVPTPHFDAPRLDHIIETPDKANAVFRAGLNLRIQDEDQDYPALVLANYLFGGSSDSRLYRRIREQEGLSYSVSSFFAASSFEKKAEFGISAIYAPQNRTRLENSVKEELQRALKEGFSEQEISAGKKGLLLARQLGRARDGALAARLVALSHLGRSFAWEEALEKRIAALSADEVNAAFRRHFKLEQISMIRAGDFKSSLAAAGRR